ncbi:sensor histidine kinase [Roseivirga thermotolerans]|uniref:sensor histidine kinase n=2 Tax=Roseivirga thermotolerans TaxID=1758176 RepID=UPI00273EC9E9|nr:sensor histidine kinase [Roseivirga thermotolerans]
MRISLLISLWLINCAMLAQSSGSLSVFDLTDQAFEQPVRLEGNWEFYWNTLEIDGLDKLTPVVLEVPSDWYDNAELGFAKTGYGTYRTLVRINPGQKEPLGLNIPHIFSSYKLFINRDLVYESGRVSTTKESYVPYREPQVFSLAPTASGTYEIIIQVANYDHVNSGMIYALELGNYADLRYELNLQQDVNLFLAGGLFITGFVLLAFSFAYQQLEWQIPFYALFSISLMYRMLGADPYPLHTLINQLPFDWSIHMEYGTIHTAALFGGLFIFYLYPRQTNKYLKYIFLSGVAISLGCVVFLEPIVFTGLLQYFLFFVLFYVAVFINIIIKAKAEKEITSGYLLFALVVVLVWTLFQVINFLSIREIPYYLNVALVSLIIVFCNLALFRTFVQKIKAIDKEDSVQQINRSKQTMLSLISHEIKTPVATLQMNMEMLRASQGARQMPPELMSKILQGASEAVEDIKEMVNDFVYFMSRGGESTGVYTFDEIADRISHRFSMEVRRPTLTKGKYKTDITTLEYVLSTLLSNARKYSMNSDRQPEIYMASVEKRLVIEVRDYGEGMTKQELTELGNPKIELNEKSEVSGVGFYLAKELTQLLGHSINVESKTGVGTSVRIEIERHD